MNYVFMTRLAVTSKAGQTRQLLVSKLRQLQYLTEVKQDKEKSAL